MALLKNPPTFYVGRSKVFLDGFTVSTSADFVLFSALMGLNQLCHW